MVLTDEQKVKIAAYLGLKLDPVNYGDTATIIAGFSTFGVTSLLVVYAWFNRNYRPIRAKNLKLVTLMLTSSIIAYFGTFTTAGLVNQVGPWSYCRLWGIWIRAPFPYLLSCFLLFRAYALDRVFNQHKAYRGWGYYMPLIVLISFLLVFCIVAQVLDTKMTVYYIDAIELCHYSDGFRYTCLAIFWFIWVLYAVYLIKIRNIKSSFNEFRENVFTCFLGVSTILETTIVHVVVPKFPLNSTIRRFSACYDFAAGNLGVWVILAYPVYMCIFHKNEYELDWLTKLASDGLTKEYGVQERVYTSTGRYSRMEDETGSLQATKTEAVADDWKYSSSQSEFHSNTNTSISGSLRNLNM
ncbi:hypothetical protein GQ54DRAFT_308243 [Martensiomyces pterosporus]|nr:hypothetical protein GQ54DRAFT_308243 [Martensiomyces pterosporus]